MASLINPPTGSSSLSLSLSLLTSLLQFLLLSPSTTTAQSTFCRTFCGDIPIHYPFGIDDGCGSPYYRNILVCHPNSTTLELRTPSGRYPVRRIRYDDPHIVVSDPFMWSCRDGNRFRPSRPFSLDTSTHFTLSSKNDYLFFNCNPDSVIVEPRTSFCDRNPDRCDSACDSASYLCRNIPECPSALGQRTSCCSYYPKATESLRLMLERCASYASVYWKVVGAVPPYDQVPEYGIRIDFEIPVTTRCLQCQDTRKGGGTCGFDTETQGFLCLCDGRNVTSYCADRSISQHRSSVGVIAGTTTAVSIGAIAVGAVIWYLKKVKQNKVVTCGVQNNENRLF
ncbi:hypothetical protein MRB53_036128 [Persea americana]|uniref:Uncharacterized protein n=1 Tax=Persea americana TaxID=3435 RepID=A0ACC2K6M8_PERAE|nr:hypothetical protein MRB53_036128 [Persea americana]|eukprot:TRINITY_DN34681_c0_g1_i2.p1 TRINITY_DN34681_c0_g1~~TRINITY_DN34681_c0_g1_i2.p1  ORF type:complete len:339 (+),score=45.00 TRINITY_DN34681_c0_g1_i2:238-1254(+)